MSAVNTASRATFVMFMLLRQAGPSGSFARIQKSFALLPLWARPRNNDVELSSSSRRPHAGRSQEIISFNGILRKSRPVQRYSQFHIVVHILAYGP